MLKSDWLKLPTEVRFFVSDQAEVLTYEIAKKFDLDSEQTVFILDLEDEVFLKDLAPMDLPNRLDKMPGSKGFDVRLLTLDLAYKVLWPLQDYIGSIDKLILRLGGKVPRMRPLKGQMAEVSGLFPGQAQGSVKEMIDKFSDFKDLRLSSNKIKNPKGSTVTPTVDNWIKDYIHFAGAGNHDSLKRAQYLSKADNPLSISQADRNSLRYLLISYDNDTPVDFDYSDLKLKVSELKEESEEKTTDINIDDRVREIGNQMKELDSKLMESSFILSEAENDLAKVRDILWKSLGLGDKYKVISCLRVLVERKGLDLMLKEDSRFKNILKRYVGIRYGKSLENILDSHSDMLIIRRIFFEMLFIDKLRLSDKKSTLATLYLTNLVSDSGQIVYLDKSDGLIKWRAIEVVGNNINWLDKV